MQWPAQPGSECLCPAGSKDTHKTDSMGALRMGSTPTPARPAWTLVLSTGGTRGRSPAPSQGKAPFCPVTTALQSSVLRKQRARQRSPNSACADNTAEGTSRAKPQEWARGSAECAHCPELHSGTDAPSHEALTAATAKKKEQTRAIHILGAALQPFPPPYFLFSPFNIVSLDFVL